MENIREFTVKNHFLVEIDNHAVQDGAGKLKTWSWDIYIAANDKAEYRGKALAPGKGIEVPWITLATENYLEEMIAHCEKRMPQ
ncbi:hypothetical protein [Halalkalibacter akibai]|uniref:Uncharacterized protein n=1 Tax=Halalkalibacter akibai (strain ATCC 43226 / DSM 21942 / CIP 109018 / JCM 9157 / 1139) TaxID=1236973 RepID=W4QPG8_HALA3|nr:hypothetical protein [Halalkalibacter akibai]GAE33244.1 hypothetical protein JCM9157_235 [Halalkalibacter akibai JCM 9157]